MLLSVYQHGSLFRLPTGGAAGGGYAQVIPMEEVREDRHPVSYYHQTLSLRMPRLSVTDERHQNHTAIRRIDPQK